MAVKIKRKDHLGSLKVADTAVNAALVELFEALQKIDTAAPLAKLNETTISDNNGGRIYL